MANRQISAERLSSLQRSYEILRTYLNLDCKQYVREVLDSDNVKPFFKEYRKDYLDTANVVEDIDFDELLLYCRSNNAFSQPKYASSVTPSKARWSCLDHAARFVVRVLRFSWDNGGEWSCGKFDCGNDESSFEFHQVWAVLRYLQAEWEAANLELWDDGSLNDAFARTMSSRL